MMLNSARRMRLITGMSVLGLAGGVLGLSAAPAGAATKPATPTCQYTVLDNPTPVYYSNFSFYEFKYPGEVVAGPPVGETIISGNGTVTNYDEVYLAVGGTGWINAAKVQPINSC
jgi:hypothetical protein